MLLLQCCCIILMGSTIFGGGVTAYKDKHFETDCGSRPQQQFLRYPTRHQRNSRHSRTPKIIAGSSTKEGQFPWQASLELLHPSLGFLGHWCGAVLIHRYWILSAAHCVHNDLFNLPIPPLWTVVLGEFNRDVESGYEQRIPIEKIVLHKNYQNFLHDLVLMKLSMPADLSKLSIVRRICLPFVYNEHGTTMEQTEAPSPLEAEILAEGWGGDTVDPLEQGLGDIPDNLDNFLRSVQSASRNHQNISFPSMKELMSTKILSRLWKNQVRSRSVKSLKSKRRRNDKFMRVHGDNPEYEGLIDRKHYKDAEEYKELPFTDCIATGWGKENSTGDLTNLLLKTSVPIQETHRCKDAYGGFVKIHRGHLCAGHLNGKGGTCVGDSGGPLQCRLSKNGPWILAGITSFGSGCAIPGFPDVYTRTSYYMKWIKDTIAQE